MADSWAILESLGTLGGTLVLAGGAIAAALYGRKANPAIEASVHTRPDGRLIVAVRASVSAPGVRSIRVATTGSHAPAITVTEVLDGGEALHYGAIYETRTFVEEDEVGAGETVAKTELFHMPVPTSNLVGWRVNFFVDVPKFLTFRQRWWTWAADTFINVPGPA